MSKVSTAETALRRDAATEESAAQRLMEDDARIESVLARQRVLENAKRDRAEAITSQIKGTRGPDILAQVFKLLSPGRKPRIDEIDDPDILDAILVSLQDDRATHAEELKAAGVATELSRKELSRAMELAALAEITLGLEGLVPLVARASELRRANAGTWPMGRHPGVIAPDGADAEFRAAIGEGLTSGSAWQARTRATLAPYIEELRIAEREELQHA